MDLTNDSPNKLKVFLLGFLLPTLYIFLLPVLALTGYANDSLGECQAPTVSNFISTPSASGAMAVVSMPTLYYILYLIKDKPLLSKYIHFFRQMFVLTWCAFLCTNTIQYPIAHIIFVTIMSIAGLTVIGLQAYEHHSCKEAFFFWMAIVFVGLLAATACIGSLIGFCNVPYWIRFLPIICEYVNLLILFSHTSICLYLSN